MKRIGEKVRQLEEPFIANTYFGNGENHYSILKGKIPILISAPHSIKHFRNGKIKSADVYTGGIARYLHQKTNCHVICTTKYMETDANYDDFEKNAYQQALVDYAINNNIKFMIDLHGASSHQEFAIEIGTAPYQDNELYSLKKDAYFITPLIIVLKEHFEKSKISPVEIWLNTVFKASNHNTVTKCFAQNTDIPCIQLEINGNYRNYLDEESMGFLVEGLIELIKKIWTLLKDGNVDSKNF